MSNGAQVRVYAFGLAEQGLFMLNAMQ